MLIKLLGIVIVVLGMVFFINIKAFQQYIAFWKDKKKIRIGGVLAFLFGIFFLTAAPQCKLTWLIVVFGIWSFIKGALLLTLSQKKINAYLNWCLNRPVLVVRFLGIIAVAFGALLIYSA